MKLILSFTRTCAIAGFGIRNKESSFTDPSGLKAFTPFANNPNLLEASINPKTFVLFYR